MMSAHLPSFCPLMSLSVKVKNELAFARDGAGAKLSICYFESGEFRGERLCGQVLPGGGDWATYRDRGHLDIDVRGVLLTADGALIYLRYEGMWRAEPDVLSRVVARGGHLHYQPDQHYLRTIARFETADARYGWLNSILALGVGARTPEGVTYEFYEIL
jgi:hypothetical protein